MCKKYKEIVPAITENEKYYYDWGSDKQFSILHGQQAECSAGVFDMIDVDIRDIRKTIKDLPDLETEDLKLESAYHLVATSARMLLVTRDIDVKSDEHAFIMFDTHFIEANLIDEKYRVLIDLAKEDNKAALLENQDLVVELGEAMQDLYKSMDDSLRFPQLKKA